MREVSRYPKQFRDGQLGWLHPLPSCPMPLTQREQPPPPPTINCRKIIEDWTKTTNPEAVRELSETLQVSVRSLRALQVCWSPEHKAWAIPMKDGYDNMVGIRLRSGSGFKWSVTGSHSGCFISLEFPQPMALVAEGFSDTAAGLDLGFYTVGRPSASGGIDQLKHFFRRVGVRKAAIVCDNDGPGVNGARMLSEHLGIPSCTITLPCKDLREFIQCGGNQRLMSSYVGQSIWKNVR